MLDALDLLTNAVENTIMDPNTSLNEWVSVIDIMDDIIENAKYVKSMIIDKVKELNKKLVDCLTIFHSAIISFQLRCAAVAFLA